MPGKTFVNYRRDDARDMAARIRDRLAASFGDANVFMDVDNLLAGQRFDKELEKALGQTDVFLAVIGPRWMELFAERQASRERDYVREEIAGALQRGVVVIPVLIERTALPRADALPEDIRDLVLHQKHAVTHEQFGRDVRGLVEAIRFGRKAARVETGGGGATVRWIGAVALVVLVLGGIVLAYQTGAPDRGAEVKRQEEKAAHDRKRAEEEKKRADEAYLLRPGGGKSARTVSVIFDSADESARVALLHPGGAKNDFGNFVNVDLKQLEFKQPAGSDVRIAECRPRGAAFHCIILEDGQGIKIVPKSEAVPDSVRLALTFESREIALTVQSKGPAAIRAEQVSRTGRSESSVDLGVDKTLSIWNIARKNGDKIRISVVDPNFQRISGIAVDRRPVSITDDRQIDIPSSAEMKAISIETEARLFSGSVNVTSDGAVRISLGSDVLETLPGGGTKEVKVKNVGSS